MKNQTVINRYARALLSLGLDDGQYGRYGEELESLAEALAALGEEAKTLTSPLYPAGVRRRMLDQILTRAALSPLVTNFVGLLLDKGHLGELNGIAATYNSLVDAEKGLIRARLTSAAPLEEAEIKAVQAALSKFSGRRVELSLDQDPGLIGGVVARLGDLTIDGSLRTQITKLAERLDRLS
ncbi:MAG: ATP synthase F1 subunit delta [Candidatus Adiutrix sp.]|jgi:F-type H+-transporting ATPase subunit delta|nr:ATP synthase F1 subunit delta [Candidatus Adiutrix sp.]